ncbi:inositol 5-phosphatase-like protein [Calycina marina]|uniref:Inositol 5-phosphatase-like protein n=1 Tax=Calycina marina TaxID=1763456 RepID=A0A9P7Z2U3_9HELO|nr:inositol 5-phosphatase-like protein [Calycina marina]
MVDDVRAYIFTFNCGRDYIDVDAFASQFFDGLSRRIIPDLIVICLQEIGPVGASLIGGSHLVPYFSKIHSAVQKAAHDQFPEDEPEQDLYKLMVAKNAGMIGIMVFARDEDTVENLETGGVGFGKANMGDKAAVGARFTYSSGKDSTELTFVSAHLAAGEIALARRNEDWKSIVRRLVFSSMADGGPDTALSGSGEEEVLLSISPQDGSIFKSTSHLFVAGDFNYRTSILSPAPNDHIEVFPQPHHDKSSPQHYTSLFENDQLNQERAAGRTMHGLIEAQVTFPPTYKYEIKEPFLMPDEDLVKWHWATHRWPSWCDRILYLPIPSWVKHEHPDAHIRTYRYAALPQQPTTDHRAVTLEVEVPLIPILQPTSNDVARLVKDRDNDPRINPPWTIDMDWKRKQVTARRLELVSGYTTYFTTTGEGVVLLLALIGGAIATVFALRAMLW